LELSDADITRIMKMIETTRPLENNQVLHFTKRLTGDESDEEEIAGVSPADPLALFKDRSILTPPRPMTPVRFHSTDPEPEDRGEHDSDYRGTTSSNALPGEGCSS
jgi:hypothetical protein